MRLKGAVIEVMPYENVDLTNYFDSVEAGIKSDLSEWKSVRRELYEGFGFNNPVGDVKKAVTEWIKRCKLDKIHKLGRANHVI